MMPIDLRRNLKLLSIDPGLTPGVSVVHGDGTMYLEVLETSPELPIAARVDFLWSKICLLIQYYEINVLAIEDVTVVRPPKGKFNNHNFVTPGLYTLVLLYAYQNNIKLLTFGPSEIKKSWTGNGKADKHLMIATFEKRFNCVQKNHNIVDAYAISHLAREVITNEYNNHRGPFNTAT